MSTQTPYRASNSQMPDEQYMNTQQIPAMHSENQPEMRGGRRGGLMRGSETKPAVRSTEFWIYLLAVGGTLLASQLVGRNADGVDIFRADRAWWLIALLTIGYLVSRGLAKAGSSWRHGG
ncbi:hypothetical protein [Solwaraspora sp. WMMD1047]|uniref:hypothetical protein n=1 Tax=Solwaraspora sp. WMMD1047 TaxID=3016102 RepID=UPI003241FD3D